MNSTPSGIDCGVTCAAGFDAGSTVTLTATPDVTSTFAGWTGAGCTGTDPCQVTMTQARTVTATFIRIYQLSVSSVGTGGGSVNSTPSGIDCGLLARPGSTPAAR